MGARPAHGIDGVLVAGDLFDTRRPDSDSLALVRGLFSRLVAAGKCVVVLPGTHDGLAYPDSVWRSERFPGVDILTSPVPATPLVREINGTPVHFYGAAHVPGRSPRPFRASSARRERAFTSGSCTESCPATPRRPRGPASGSCLSRRPVTAASTTWRSATATR